MSDFNGTLPPESDSLASLRREFNEWLENRELNDFVTWSNSNLRKARWPVHFQEYVKSEIKKLPSYKTVEVQDMGEAERHAGDLARLARIHFQAYLRKAEKRAHILEGQIKS